MIVFCNDKTQGFEMTKHNPPPLLPRAGAGHANPAAALHHHHKAILQCTPTEGAATHRLPGLPSGSVSLTLASSWLLRTDGSSVPM